MNKFFNQNGMSLVSVLMASALAGGLALVVAKIGQNSSTITQESSKASEINEIYNRFQRYMLNGYNCQATLKEAGQLINNTPTPKSIKKIFTDIDGIKLDDNGVDISTKRIEKFDIDNQVGRVEIQKIELTRSNKRDVLMEISFNKGSKDKPRIIKKRIELAANFDDSGIVTKCYSQMDEAITTARRRACEDRGGELVDGENEADYVCEIESSADENGDYPYLENSPIRSLNIDAFESGAEKSISIYKEDQYKFCYVIGSGIVTSTKKRFNRSSTCEVKKSSGYWRIFAKSVRSNSICNVQCVKLCSKPIDGRKVVDTEGDCKRDDTDPMKGTKVVKYKCEGRQCRGKCPPGPYTATVQCVPPADTNCPGGRRNCIGADPDDRGDQDRYDY